MARRHNREQYALCIRNQSCDDLVTLKLYRVLPDKSAARDGYVRVVDESGEDYLYPESYFVKLRFAREAREAMSAAGLRA
jgi:hypothetical protein